jgi:cell division protease FtsH
MGPLTKWLPTLVLLAVVVLFGLFVGLQQPTQETAQPIPYTRAKALIAQGAVDSVTLRGTRLTGVFKSPVPLSEGQPSVTAFDTEIPAVGDPTLLPALENAGVQVTAQAAEESSGWRVLTGLLPWLLFLGIYWWFWRRTFRNIAGGLDGLGGAGGVLRSPRHEKTIDVPKVTFKDVAGQDNAKREVSELVDFLRDPDRYTRLGAEVPRGVLLMGPPGTGKTLLARALAGEAGVPFFSISASEFIEVFVGVGASRVRRMFDDAKARQPSIIFIDELDSVGRVRGAGFGGGHDEREQTLNQILAELDGFEGHEAVIVLAATNRPDVLDPALLRPGRFDRHVTLDLPDKDARVAILKVHTRKIPLAADVDLETVAAGTPGFSGADIKNLCNEAAMAAARDGMTEVAMRHFDDMRERIMLGTVRTLAIQPEERHRLAVHEAGHVTVAYFLPEADPLYKVTIIPRGRALGVTHQLPTEERHTLPEAYLHDRLAVALGGRVAEREVLGSISSGADDDIRNATALARAMISRWGMSKELGPVDLRESDEHPFLGREIALPRHFSDAAASEVDKEVRRLLLAEEARAESVIRAHREGLDRLVAALEKEESLDRAAIEAALGPSPLKAARPAVVASTEIDTDAIAGSAQEKSGAA